MFGLKNYRCCNTFHAPLMKHDCSNETKAPNTTPSIHRPCDPRSRAVFYSGPVGINLLRTEVSPHDPNCHVILYKYNPLHDPHLKVWWNSSPEKREFLYKQGLITLDGRVYCNVKDNNEYERCLRRRDNYLANVRRDHDDRQKQERVQVFNADLNNRKAIAKKLKALKAILLEDKLRNAPKKSVKFKKNRIKKTSKPLKKKNIETYTVYGLDKNGKIDRNKYLGTFIKGSPDDYHLLGLFNKFFQNDVELH